MNTLEHTINFHNDVILDAIITIIPNRENCDHSVRRAVSFLYGMPCYPFAKLRCNMKIMVANELAKYAFTGSLDVDLLNKIYEVDRNLGRKALPPHVN
jgi:hypothetical protein